MTAFKENFFVILFAMSLSGSQILACPTPVYSPTSQPGISYKHHWNSSKKKSEKTKKEVPAPDNLAK